MPLVRSRLGGGRPFWDGKSGVPRPNVINNGRDGRWAFEVGDFVRGGAPVGQLRMRSRIVSGSEFSWLIISSVKTLAMSVTT
jgi:hypothetical protein